MPESEQPNCSLSSSSKCFKISDELSPFVGTTFPNGTFIVCRLCSVWDDKGIKFAKVHLRNNFWTGYFKNHVCSAQHKNNFMRKSRFEEANLRILEERGRTQKRLKQTVLIFAPKSHTPSQVRERVAGGVCPLATSSETLTKRKRQSCVCVR